tara:strand:+ start:556 stop:1335 length:780 start_codon:yes stop_codon:yes gene_type:complete
MRVAFTIITVTFNAKEELIKTINSVQNQKYLDFIHIIKDGLSTDETDKINFSKFSSTFYYRSNDKGVYDAMNQGFNFAKNEFIIFLNAGDIFLSNNSLDKIALFIKRNPKFNSFVGGTLQIEKKNNKVKRVMGIGILPKYLPLSQLPHPSLILRKSLLSKLNTPFDSYLKISADYKQQLILSKRKLLKTYFINEIITIMPLGGISNKNRFSIIKGYLETFAEAFKIYKILSIYIITLKILLYFYSIFISRKFSKLNFDY